MFEKEKNVALAGEMSIKRQFKTRGYSAKNTITLFQFYNGNKIALVFLNRKTKSYTIKSILFKTMLTIFFGNINNNCFIIC